LEDKVHFGGWVSLDQKYETLAKGDIGLLLHKVCDLTQHTVPNKLFDYMSTGLPVISTKLRPVTRILEKERCGIAVEETPASVAEGMRTLITNQGMRKKFTGNGRRAVRARYTWESESEKIFTNVRNLIDRSDSTRQAS